VSTPMQPQDAFEELAGLKLAEHSLDTIMDKIARLTKRTITGATEVSVTFVEWDKPTTVAYTGPLALHLDERQYDRGYGPAWTPSPAACRWSSLTWRRSAGGRSSPRRPSSMAHTAR
jgi:hypothetical protein